MSKSDKDKLSKEVMENSGRALFEISILIMYLYAKLGIIFEIDNYFYSFFQIIV